MLIYIFGIFENVKEKTLPVRFMLKLSLVKFYLLSLKKIKCVRQTV